MRWIVDRFLAIDPRSLGLFRLLFGLTLIGDLFQRWDWVRAFYSNDGVLPNHNHLFLLMDQGQTWSLYHSFSSVDEAHFAMLVTLGIYLCFTIGYKTRALHLASLLCLISLCGRNILFDNVGQSVAIALMAMTALLPLGDRLSVDEMLRNGEVQEKNPDALNDRSQPPRRPARASLAALGVLVLLAIVYYGAALQQVGETWKDGSALYYALHVDRWTGRLGVALRGSAGLLTGWTKALWIAQLIIVPLALVPLQRHITRSIAIGAMLFHALTFGLLFTFGLYGWSLVAAAALLIPSELWERLDRQTHPVTLFYDADCGICLWCARMLKRWDSRANITFRSNSGELPEGVSEEMTSRSMVVVTDDGQPLTDASAMSQVMMAARPLWLFGVLIKLPGLQQLARALYLRVASRRLEVSEAFGMGACGVPRPDADHVAPNDDTDGQSPASKLWRGLVFSAGAACSVLIVAATLAQSERVGELPVRVGLGQSELLVDIATWCRVTAPWGVWAPDPPKANEALVVEAETRGGWRVDVISGTEPDLELTQPSAHRQGALWSAYTRRIADDEYTPFRKEFRRYLTRGGAVVDTRVQDNYIQKMTAYWVTAPTPAPGEARAEVSRVELFGQRGRVGGPRTTPKPNGKRVRPGMPDKLPPFFPKKQQ